MRTSIYSKENIALSNWLRLQRENAELTQRQLAKILKVHHSIIGKIETGERRIDATELVKYCQELGINPHEAMDVIVEAIK